jgi:anhydro-N-acetylmuramic acid kinase
MIYRTIGLMSGSSLDGLDIAYVEFEEVGGKWTYQVIASECVSYDEDWHKRLANAKDLSARNLHILDMQYGAFLGYQVNAFMEKYQLEYKVALIASHGHTIFHEPGVSSVQIGHGAAIAAAIKLPVVSDLRSMDVALGGQGAPIVPMGEKILFPGVSYFLNIGGIANISYHDQIIHDAFDVCPANRVLNLLSAQVGQTYDNNGKLAASGNVNDELLRELNSLHYYREVYPKSLANDFGTEIVFPLILSYGLSTEDALATYVEHIATQVADAVRMICFERTLRLSGDNMVISGGGALNEYLVQKIAAHLTPFSINVSIPDESTIHFKEAIIMALLGVLRWREEDTVMASVTGASRDSIGGALWMGN